MDNGRQYSFYSFIEEPLENITYLYVKFLLEMKEMRGIRIFKPPENYDGGLYVHIPNMTRIFCFRDWFNTRIDLESGWNVIDDSFYRSINKLAKILLDSNQSLDVDYDIVFFNMFTKEYKKRIDIEKSDRWRNRR
jgi:hypothetical protein